MIQDLQIRLSKSSEAVSFSDNVLALSREQTESIHKLREQMKQQDVLYVAKQEELQSVRAAAEQDAADLRRRLIALTEHNQKLQSERKTDDSEVYQLRVQADELRGQLVASVQLGEANFKKNNEMKMRLVQMKKTMVKRIISHWLHASAATAFGGWVQVVQASKIAGYAQLQNADRVTHVSGRGIPFSPSMSINFLPKAEALSPITGAYGSNENVSSNVLRSTQSSWRQLPPTTPATGSNLEPPPSWARNFAPGGLFYGTQENAGANNSSVSQDSTISNRPPFRTDQVATPADSTPALGQTYTTGGTRGAESLSQDHEIVF